MNKKFSYKERIADCILDNVALFEDTKISEDEVCKFIRSGASYNKDVVIMSDERFESVFDSLLHRNRYALLTTFERETTVQFFETFEEAHNQMEKELKDCFAYRLGEWDEFQYEYAEKGVASMDDCELAEKYAWSNIHCCCETDWVIIDIPLGKE